MSNKNKIGSFLINVYSIIRRPVNKAINIIITNKLADVPDIDFENTYAKMSENVFRQEIMSFPYQYDPLGGLIDFTFLNPKYFFWKELEFGRDCDSFSYMWYLYHIFNGRKAWIYVVIPDYDIKKAHAICITKKENGRYEFFDYHMTDSSDTLKGLLEVYYDRFYAPAGYKTISYGIMKRNKTKEQVKELMNKF